MPPIFQPLWIRLLLAVLAGAWAGYEFYDGSAIWGVLFAAFAAYTVFGVWTDFSSRPPANAPAGDKHSAEEEPARKGEDRDQHGA